MLLSAIKISKFKNYEIDKDQTNLVLEYSVELKNMLDKENINYAFSGSLSNIFRNKKIYRTPKDIDIVLARQIDFDLAFNFFLKNDFFLKGLHDHPNHKNLKKGSKEIQDLYNIYIKSRERFAENILNSHKLECENATTFDLTSIAVEEDFKDLKKESYYVLHDPKKIGYIKETKNLIKIKSKYKYPQGDAVQFMNVFMYVYYTIDGSDPKGKYGVPLNNTTKVIPCHVVDIDGTGGFIYSSEKIDKKNITKDFKYKIGLYVTTSTLEFINQKNKIKIGIILAGEPLSIEKHKLNNIEFKVCDPCGCNGHKYLRLKDFDDWEFYNFYKFLDKEIFKNLNKKGNKNYFKKFKQIQINLKKENKLFFECSKSFKVNSFNEYKKIKFKNIKHLISFCKDKRSFRWCRLAYRPLLQDKTYLLPNLSDQDLIKNKVFL